MSDRVDRYRWWQALRASDLSATARHAALTLSTYMDADGGDCWPALTTLAEDMGKSRATAARAVDELVEAGYVLRTSGGGRRAGGLYVANRYQAAVPSGLTDETATPAESRLTHETPAPPKSSRTDETADRRAVSSGGRAVSPTRVSGLTHETRSTHEVPIEEPMENHDDLRRVPTPPPSRNDLDRERDRIAQEQHGTDYRHLPGVDRNVIDQQARHQLAQRGAA